MLILILLFIWQLPLNLIGLLYKDVLTLKDDCLLINKTDDYEVYVKSKLGGVTLGKYIFVSPWFSVETIKHEVGHTKLSKYLGPFYLIVIGIPSMIWAGLRNASPKLRKKYSSDWLYTERWANKLSDL